MKEGWKRLRNKLREALKRQREAKSGQSTKSIESGDYHAQLRVQWEIFNSVMSARENYLISHTQIANSLIPLRDISTESSNASSGQLDFQTLSPARTTARTTGLYTVVPNTTGSNIELTDETLSDFQMLIDHTIPGNFNVGN